MEQVAARVSSSAVVIALLAALDDWGVCAVDKNRREWTLGVARRADRFESPWRTRARDPNVLGDPVMYAALMRSAPVDTESVQLLTAIAERRGNGGGEVVPFLMRVQAFHPDDFWANTSLGEALVHKGDATGAIAYYVAAVALRPTSAVAHDNLGTALGRCGRLDSAMDELRRAIRIEPEFAHAHSSLGNCLKLNRQFEEAVAEHREAVRLDPQNPGYHSNLGTALENISQVADAIREYRASIQIAPHYPAAHLNLGAALCKAGQYDEGLQECREAARLDPEDPDAHSVLGRKLAAVHRMNDALGEFEAASRLNPRSAECRADVGIALAELGNVDKAVEMHRQALALDPECNASTVQLRRELIQNGRTQEVYAIWQSALLADPPAFGARNGFAEFSLYLERQDDYQRECQTLVRRFGTDADAGLLGRVAEVCLLAPSSDEDVNAAAALIERSGLGMEFAKGLLEYRRGHLEAALPLLQGAAHHDEGVGVGPAPYFVLAIIQHRRGEDREARRILADAILQASWREADAGDRTAWTWHALRRQAEIEILPNLPAFLAGTYRPRDNDERFALMGACQFKNLHHVLAGLYRDAFQADPTLPRSDRAAFKYNAACDAALAGSTRGENAVPLADEERARWRDQARRWLRDDLDAVAQGANGADQDRNRAHQVLMQWRSDPDLGGLRDPDRLATLSDPEREECLQLWAEVDRVLALTQEPR
jgi:tetratricopeptide (TPR) repeat protein